LYPVSHKVFSALAPNQRTQTGSQFLDGEGFGEVIIRALIEPFDFLALSGLFASPNRYRGIVLLGLQ
jgi:hypothetical protein